MPGGATARTLDEPDSAEGGGARAVPERAVLLSDAVAHTLAMGRERTAVLPGKPPLAPESGPAPRPVARTEFLPENGKLISGLIEPRPPGGGGVRAATLGVPVLRPAAPGSGSGRVPTATGHGPPPGTIPLAPLRSSPVPSPFDQPRPPAPFPTSAPGLDGPAAPRPATAPGGFRAPGVGARLGQYEIIRELGAGGMGVVYLARDDRLGRRVAIKFLQTGNAELTRRFIIEARATARCSHENIVVIFEVGELQGSPFMVLEYLQGQTLSTVIKKSAPMPPSRAVELMAAVVRALACAHEQGIVHRDLKPDNILLTDAGTIKVLDFGIAKVLQEEPRDPEAHRDQSRPEAIGSAALDLAARTGIVGTMAYMSPEQWGVGGPIDHRTDIWATGLILFQMLTGRHPLETLGGDPHAWVTDLDSPLPSLGHEAPDIPPELAEIVDRCLRKHKEDRIPDAASLLRALEPFMPGRFAARGAQPVESGPYAGLRAFQEEDAGRFFGRSREIAALATRIRDTPLMAAVGPSGIGKSSLIRAGVVPALKSSGEPWEALVVRPGRDPMSALAGLLAPLVSSSPNAVEDLVAQRELSKRFASEPGYLGSALRSISRRSGRKILLFIDQFEELYTLSSDPAERRAFTAALAGAADDVTSPVRVVASIRSDFLGRAAEDPHFMNELGKGLFFLGPPTADGLREAIVQPAELAGYRFETPMMVDEMIEHLESTPAALPLLQFAAAQLWESRDPRRKMLTEQSYHDLGGIAGALVSHADKVIAKLVPDVQALARPLFVQLVTAERTRAVRDLDELRETSANKAELGRLIDYLVDSRLLVVQTGSGGGVATVEIVHESLIATWPMLRRWLDESQEDSLFLEQLRQAARQWHANKRDGGLLWGGDMVDELARFQRRYRGEMPDIVRAFSDEVFRRRERGARRRRRLLAAAGAIGVVMLAAAAVALVVIRNSQMAAERNAAAATVAKGEAQRRLQEVESKERERQREESQKRVAQTEAATAKGEVEKTNEELAEKNVELGNALEKAKEQRQRAESAQVVAEKNEKSAREAEERARLSAQQLEILLKKERDRADRLNSQLGQLVERLR
ncbi:MAG TPA: protein kinase [Polyangia bacterium]|nr:protein kinase [Polyangia bacterium]